MRTSLASSRHSVQIFVASTMGRAKSLSEFEMTVAESEASNNASTLSSLPPNTCDAPASRLADNPRWYETAVFYELLPRGFFDNNTDGIGDLEGIISKLD